MKTDPKKITQSHFLSGNICIVRLHFAFCRGKLTWNPFAGNRLCSSNDLPGQSINCLWRSELLSPLSRVVVVVVKHIDSEITFKDGRLIAIRQKGLKRYMLRGSDWLLCYAKGWNVHHKIPVDSYSDKNCVSLYQVSQICEYSKNYMAPERNLAGHLCSDLET